MADTKPRESLHVKLDADLARLVRIHRAETRESANELINRLLRAVFESQLPKPAA